MRIVKALKFIGWLVLVSAIIVGVSMSIQVVPKYLMIRSDETETVFHFLNGVPFYISGVVVLIIFYACAEVIMLLHSINNKIK